MRFNRFARLIVASCLIAFILLAVPAVAQQQRLQVIRNVRLHTEPSSTSPKVRTLEPPEIVTRESAGETNNSQEYPLENQPSMLKESDRGAAGSMLVAGIGDLAGAGVMASSRPHAARTKTTAEITSGKWRTRGHLTKLDHSVGPP